MVTVASHFCCEITMIVLNPQVKNIHDRTESSY